MISRKHFEFLCMSLHPPLSSLSKSWQEFRLHSGSHFWLINKSIGFELSPCHLTCKPGQNSIQPHDLSLYNPPNRPVLDLLIKGLVQPSELRSLVLIVLNHTNEWLRSVRAYICQECSAQTIWSDPLLPICGNRSHGLGLMYWWTEVQIKHFKTFPNIV